MRPRALTRPVRAVAAGAALVGLVLSSAACNPGRPPAATVEGTDISAERLDQVIAAYIDADRETNAPDLEGQGEGTYRLAAASQILNTLVLQTIQSELAVREGAIPTADERSEAADAVRFSFASGAFVEPEAEPTEEQLAAQEESTKVFDALPEDLQDWLIDLRADTIALERVSGLSDEERDARGREAFEANPDLFTDTYCLRAIVIQSTDVPVLQDRLAAGEDFGALAAELSLDQQTGPSGGELGQCLPGDQLEAAGLDAAIVTVVQPLAVGDVSEPFDLGQGTVVVFDRRPVTYEDVQEQILATIPPGGQEAVTELIRDEIGGLDVSIDPRFGTWDAERGTITPPDGARAPETTEALLDGGTPTVPAGG